MKNDIKDFDDADFNAEGTESSGTFLANEKVDHNKIDSRRRLEDYLEQKRLEKELSDY